MIRAVLYTEKEKLEIRVTNMMIKVFSTKTQCMLLFPVQVITFSAAHFRLLSNLSIREGRACCVILKLVLQWRLDKNHD